VRQAHRNTGAAFEPHSWHRYRATISISGIRRENEAACPGVIVKSLPAMLETQLPQSLNGFPRIDEGDATILEAPNIACSNRGLCCTCSRSD
jgi:hypothetical protein